MEMMDFFTVAGQFGGMGRKPGLCCAKQVRMEYYEKKKNITNTVRTGDGKNKKGFTQCIAMNKTCIGKK